MRVHAHLALFVWETGTSGPRRVVLWRSPGVGKGENVENLDLDLLEDE